MNFLIVRIKILGFKKKKFAVNNFYVSAESDGIAFETNFALHSPHFFFFVSALAAAESPARQFADVTLTTHASGHEDSVISREFVAVGSLLDIRTAPHYLTSASSVPHHTVSSVTSAHQRWGQQKLMKPHNSPAAAIAAAAIGS